MKTLTKDVLKFLMIGLLFTIVSCGPREYKKIPLDSLDPKLKETGSVIVNDILTSFNHKHGAYSLLDKDYMTPLLHAKIKRYIKTYNNVYAMMQLAVGKISSYKLFQVIDKGVIRTMRYKLETDNKNLDFVELKIDVNLANGLADYYLYVTTKDGSVQRENILPQTINK